MIRAVEVTAPPENLACRSGLLPSLASLLHLYFLRALANPLIRERAIPHFFHILLCKTACGGVFSPLSLHTDQRTGFQLLTPSLAEL
jgi:hypothetical protein